MIALLLKRPIALYMLYLGIVILGAVSFVNLVVEGQPDLERPRLVVRTSWPNTSPEVVQVFLTSPIEERGAQVEGLEQIRSVSRRGFSSVTFRFNRETDMDFARLDLNERLSQLRANLPSGAHQPTIHMAERRSAIGERNFMSCEISGPYDRQYLSELFNRVLKDEIASVDGVAELEVYGERRRTLKIRLNRDRLSLYGLVPHHVVTKIGELTKIYETPRTHFQNNEYSISISNSIGTVEEVENLVITHFQGQPVKLYELARVELGHSRLLSLSRLNGNPTLRVNIEKEVGKSLIQTARRVRDRVDTLLADMPHGFRLDWSRDEGEMMEGQLHSIYKRGAWCIFLIVILLLIFLQSLSAAMVITLNIFFSVLITINFMYYFNVTFNVVTLSGLAVGFGMLVDNAIVVLENIFRYRELGYSRVESAIHGVRDIIWAILAATLTTVAAFLCMAFLEDRLSAAYFPLALAVIFSLSASLLVSFSFTPMLSLLIRGSNLKGGRRWVHRFLVQPLRKATELYGEIVLWTLRHKMLLLLTTSAILFMFGRIFWKEIDKGGFSFFVPPNDQVQINVRMPEGAQLETADNVIRQFEKPLLDLSGYKDMAVTVRDNFARLELSFEPEILNSNFPSALKSKMITIAQNFAGVSLSVGGINNDDNYFSGSTGFENYNSSIRLVGYNYKQLMEYAEAILKTIKRNRRVKSSRIDTSYNYFFAKDQTETVIHLNREALSRHNVEVEYAMGYLLRNLQVETRARTKYRGEEIGLEIKFDNADAFDIKDLESLVIVTEEGERVRLADLTTISERKIPHAIGRRDQQFMALVRWDYKGSSKRARAFNEAVYNGLKLPPGFKAELDYTRYLSREENKNLIFVIILAILVVFMIISALYESFVDPLVIFATIPLSFVGVSWIYWYTNNSFDSSSYIGLIILAGIVVNNSILLVSHLNHEMATRTQTGLSFQEAIAKACKDRIRPILLTAITTVVGLLPLLEEFVVWFLGTPLLSFAFRVLGLETPQLGADNASLQSTLSMFSSLSRATVGGMLTATFSTLFIIPVVYALFFRAKQWLHDRINEVFSLT